MINSEIENRSIKILVISDYRDFHTVRPEAEIFIALAKMDFKIYIMTYKDAKYVPIFETAGIKIIDFHPEKKFNKSEIHKIREEIIKNKIDIVHLFNSKAIINGIQAAKGLPVKVVVYRGYTGNVHWYDPTAYIKYLHPRVDKIFCNSIGVEEHFHKQLFFDKRKTITINKGHDIKWYENYNPYDIRKELSIPTDTFLLINVANNRKMKGIPYLLQAMNLLPAELPIHLILAGKNMDNKTNLKIINQGDQKNNIHFLGYRKDVLNIVASSNVFVLPSIKGESITKSVIEAMSLEVTPIISDISGNKELIVNNESGIVVPAKNPEEISRAIIKLYKDQTLCKELGKNAKKRIVEHLNSLQTIVKTKNLYEDLISKK